MPRAQKTQQSSRRRRWRRLLEFLLLAGVIFGVHVYQTRNLVRGPAPAFGAHLLDGSEVTLNDYRGASLLLHFWATWCPVCRLEQGSIDALARDHQVLTVTLDDMGAHDLQRWMAERGLTYPVAFDDNGQLARKYGVKGVPSSIVIDADGNIRFIEVGYTTEVGLRLRLWWAGR